MERYSNGDWSDFDLCCRMFEKAKKCGPDNLKKSSLEAIIRKTPTIFNTKSFLVLSTESLVEILQNDHLQLENELQLFKIVMRMGHHKCTNLKIESTPSNLSKILKELIPLIRFPQMTTEEFFNYVQPTNILEPEQLDFMKKWFLKKIRNNNDKITMDQVQMFNTKPRNYLTYSVNICETTVQFTKALKTLEDVSTSGVFSGHVNVMQLEHILSQMHLSMNHLTEDFKATRGSFLEVKNTRTNFLEKTKYLEFLHGKDKKELTEAQQESDSKIRKLTLDLQSTRKELSNIKVHVETTNLSLNETRDELVQTKRELQMTIKDLNGIKSELQINKVILESTKDSFTRSQKELSEAQFNIQKIQDDFKSAQRELNEILITLKQDKRIKNNEDTRNNFQKMKVEKEPVDESSNDLIKTPSHMKELEDVSKHSDQTPIILVEDTKGNISQVDAEPSDGTSKPTNVARVLK